MLVQMEEWAAERGMAAKRGEGAASSMAVIHMSVPTTHP